MPPDICIVAGGPSARGFDFRKIASSKIIAVNDSFLSVPRSDAVVSIDRDWITDRACELIRYPGELFTLHRPGEARPWTRCGQRCWTFRTEPGLSESWAEVFSVGCSGSAALNVAYLMRPRSIGLIGFDYDGSGGHWFNDSTDLAALESLKHPPFVFHCPIVSSGRRSNAVILELGL